MTKVVLDSRHVYWMGRKCIGRGRNQIKVFVSKEMALSAIVLRRDFCPVRN
jgi:hypothetical protein